MHLHVHTPTSAMPSADVLALGGRCAFALGLAASLLVSVLLLGLPVSRRFRLRQPPSNGR